MPRELSQAEKDYVVKNHKEMSPEDICEDMPGIGPKTIMSFIEGGILPEVTKDETHEEYQEKLKKAGRAGLTAGKLMARDPDRGIAMMTEGASQMSDTMRNRNSSSNDKTAKSNENRIHIMDKKKRVR